MDVYTKHITDGLGYAMLLSWTGDIKFSFEKNKRDDCINDVLAVDACKTNAFAQYFVQHKNNNNTVGTFLSHVSYSDADLQPFFHEMRDRLVLHSTRDLFDNVKRHLCNAVRQHLEKTYLTLINSDTPTMFDWELVVGAGEALNFSDKEIYSSMTYILKRIMDTEFLKNNDVGEECSICMGNLQQGVTTPCGHVFCMSCLFRWYEMRNETCPYCRRKTLIIDGFQEALELVK